MTATSRPWENSRPAEDFTPPGMKFTTIKKATHECGWYCHHPFEDPAGFTARWSAHLAVCPWPDAAEPVETVSD